MQKVQLVVENEFIKTKVADNKSPITVYNRAFNKLVVEGSSIGKIQPIYLKICNRYKVFGIITMNASGSYSFFPEAPGDNSSFDHLTFVKDLAKNNHHYTRTTFWGREKVLPIHAEHISNEMYHGATFICSDFSLLKNASKEVYYPPVNIMYLKQVRDAFVISGKKNGSITLYLNDNVGTFCLQFFLIPRGTDPKKMDIFTSPLEKALANFDISKEGEIAVHKMCISHAYPSNYSLGIVNFMLKKNTGPSYSIFTTAIKQGFYSKVDISWLKKKKI